jgi:hypothetical protein
MVGVAHQREIAMICAKRSIKRYIAVTALIIFAVLLMYAGMRLGSKIKKGGFDRFVFSKGELITVRKYENINVGVRTVDVIEALGEPDMIFVKDLQKGTYSLMDKEGKNNYSVKSVSKVNKAKMENVNMAILYSRSIDKIVYVYVEGTVAGYYFIDNENRVVYKCILTS